MPWKKDKLSAGYKVSFFAQKYPMNVVSCFIIFSLTQVLSINWINEGSSTWRCHSFNSKSHQKGGCWGEKEEARRAKMWHSYTLRFNLWNICVIAWGENIAKEKNQTSKESTKSVSHTGTKVWQEQRKV